jgi:hypothetical protein
MPSDEPSPNSSSTTRLTPESDSEEDSDLELGEVGESFKLQRRGKDVEKATSADENDENDDDDDNNEEGVYDGHQRQHRRASVSTVQSYQLYTPDEERAVVRKFDRKLVLFVALLYMLSFLDRSSMALTL